MRRALLTGASSGIGKELSYLLAKEGYALTLIGRNEEALIALNEQLAKSTQVEYHLLDLSAPTKLLTLIEKGEYSLIVNNAAFGLYGEATSLSLEEQEEMVEVNVKTVMAATIAGARAMQEGVIVNISSVASFMPTPNMAVYGATKAFVTSFSQSVDYEMKDKGVRVLVSCPGMVATPFATRAAKKKVPRQVMQMSVKKAAREILWQIKKKKGVHIFDSKTKAAFFLSKLLPKSYCMRKVFKSIEKRI